MKIGYVIDSTVDLPAEIILQHNIRIVPLSIIWGEDHYSDRVDLAADDFFSRLISSSINPRSSAPAVGAFFTAYHELLAEGTDLIISLHLSSKLSGTVQAASIAASMAGKAKVKVYDSLSASVGTGLMLLKIIDILSSGGTISDIDGFFEHDRKNVDVFLIVDNLEYLCRGGRIGSAQKILGELLHVKPLLAIKDGSVVPFGKIFGHKNIVKEVDHMFKTWHTDGRKLEYTGFAYSNSEDLCPELINLARHYYPEAKIVKVQVSPVIGCHVGPGLLGFAVL